ncbi:hypothetical protein Tco_1164295 [Tanacetum coccineum]
MCHHHSSSSFARLFSVSADILLIPSLLIRNSSLSRSNALNNQFKTRAKSSFSNTVHGVLKNPNIYVPPTKKDWDILFQSMFDEYFNSPSSVASLVPTVVALELADSTGTPSSTTNDQDEPSPSTSQTPQESQSSVILFDVEEQFQDIKVAHLDNDPFFGVPVPEPNSKESSSGDVILTNVHSVN